MFESVSRSWSLAKVSFAVVKADKELLLFPLLAAIFSVSFALLMIVPMLMPAVLEILGFTGASDVLWYPVMFVVYFGLAFIATFFNVCVVYTTKVRLEGGNATFGDSIGFAFGRLNQILMWSFVSATVGLLLRALDRIGERMGKSGEIIMKIVTSVLGAVWSIATIFVIPVMVYEGVGPFDAVKSSISTLKKTWGEALVQGVGLGLAQMIILLPVMFIMGLATLAAVSIGLPWYLVLALAVLGGTAVLAIMLVFSVLNAVFTTALYVYAKKGKITGGFDKELLKSAFGEKASI